MLKIFSIVVLAFIAINVCVEGKDVKKKYNLDFKRVNISVSENNEYAKLISRGNYRAVQWKMNVPLTGPKSLRYIWKDNWSKPEEKDAQYDPRPICTIKALSNDRDLAFQKLLSPSSNDCKPITGSRSFKSNGRAPNFMSLSVLECKTSQTVLEIVPQNDLKPIATIAYDTKITGSWCK